MGLKTLILSTYFYVFLHIPHGTEEKNSLGAHLQNRANTQLFDSLYLDFHPQSTGQEVTDTTDAYAQISLDT
eukprot:scaffold84771_cov43-Attheya_sp.AAC.2